MQERKRRFLPPIDSLWFHLMLIVVATFILGPLGGIVGTFMLLSIGFSVGGQVIASLLGSAVTYRYGPEGRHGGNYMQTMAASVASIASLAVVVQTRRWLGLADLPNWHLMLYVIAIGFFAIGVGMLYTPLVVDRMKLKFPSGLAAANILKALTDPKLLKQSISKLGIGGGLGLLLGVTAGKSAFVGETMGLSMSTIGAGMVVGARIAIPGLIVAAFGVVIKPYLISIGWLATGQPFRKIGFVVALGMILGAALIDIALVFYDVFKMIKKRKEIGAVVKEEPDWKRTNKLRLILWVVFWGAMVFVVGVGLLKLNAGMLALAVGLTFVFLLINGISTGITDSNSVSAAFVIGVFLMGVLGLRDINTGLMCAAVLLVGCTVGVDMQQDRSTGWRLGTNRTVQFRYQWLGVIVGAVLLVFLAKVFLVAYPILNVNQVAGKVPGTERWNSAFTYKLVSVISELNKPNPHFKTALELGFFIGLITQVLRKLIKGSKKYKAFVKKDKVGFATDFALDAFILPTPYASSFGGFVELLTTAWFTLGGVAASLWKTFANNNANKVTLATAWVTLHGIPAFFRDLLAFLRGIPAFFRNTPSSLWKAITGKTAATTTDDEEKEDDEEGGPLEEISPLYLVASGLIAGDSLAALGLGLYALISTVL